MRLFALMAFASTACSLTTHVRAPDRQASIRPSNFPGRSVGQHRLSASTYSVFQTPLPPGGLLEAKLPQQHIPTTGSLAAVALPTAFLNKIPPKVKVAVVTAAVAVVWVKWLRAQRSLKQRQSADATSEWGRFANAPGARSRALLAGLLRMAPSVLRSRFARSPASKATLRRRAGECLANELIRLGPTYVKIGQIVSCRENLLPQEYVSALARLQDRVPSFDGARAAQLAAQALAGEAGVGGEVGGDSGNDDGGGGGSRNDAATAAKKKRKKNVSPGGGGGSTDANADDAAATLDKVFQFFDTTPLAAASLGQVHRATLRPGVLAAARKRQKQLQLQQRQQQQQQLQQQELQQPPQGEEQQPERMIGSSSSSSSSSGGDTTAASTTFTIDDDGGDDGGALEVCVKVQREGLRLIYDKDLQLLGKMAMALDRFGVGVGGMGQRWAELFEEASEVLYQEIDYRAEAASALRFGEAFKTLPWATTPKVYPELCTDKLLVMEYLPGVKISDVQELEAKGFSRKVLARNLAKAYLYQFCKFGFFNTDPHPGNLAVDSGPPPPPKGQGKGRPRRMQIGGGGGDGAGDDALPSPTQPDGRLIFYDFGQACELSTPQQEGVLETIEAIVDLDPVACVAAFNKLGVLREGADQEKLVEMVRKNFASGRVRSKASTSKKKEQEAEKEEEEGKQAEEKKKKDEKGNVVEEEVVSTAAATAASREALPDFVMPAQLAFVARALAQMEGVGRTLDEDFEFVAAAAPLIPELKGSRVYLEQWFTKQARAFQRLLPPEMRGGTKGGKARRSSRSRSLQ